MTVFFKEKKQIENWLILQKVKDYTLIKDKNYGYVVDVQADVHLSKRDLEFIPVKFNVIKGSFCCDGNKLKELDFCPHTVSNSFYCENNFIQSLKGCPQHVGSGFYCDNNQITSLEYAPSQIEGNFDCSMNPLNTLKDCPLIVKATFRCKDTQLESMQYIPEFVQGQFNAQENPLLGNLQQKYKFEDFKKAHEEFIAKATMEKLNFVLANEKKSTHKIKI